MLESLQIPLDVTAYSSTNVVPKKIGHGFVITREMIEDSLIPIQQDQLVRASLRVANKIDKDCIDAIQAGRSGSVAATGKSLALDGTEFVLSGSGGPGIGMYDIITAKSYVEGNNYMPDRVEKKLLRETLLIHPYAKKYIERLPHFTAMFAVGSPVMVTGLIATPGKFGEILGLDAYASTNCPTGSAFVLSRGRTTNILGQYKGLNKTLLKVRWDSSWSFLTRNSKLVTIQKAHHNGYKANGRKGQHGNFHHDKVRCNGIEGRNSN
jgi:hypothetical protein